MTTPRTTSPCPHFTHLERHECSSCADLDRAKARRRRIDERTAIVLRAVARREAAAAARQADRDGVIGGAA